MAHSNNCIITGKLQGTSGKELVFRQWGGKTIAAKAPKRRTGNSSPEHVKTQDKFLAGFCYPGSIAVGQSMLQVSIKSGSIAVFYSISPISKPNS